VRQKHTKILVEEGFMVDNKRQKKFTVSVLAALVSVMMALQMMVPATHVSGADTSSVWHLISQASQTVSYASAATDGKLVVVVGTRGAVALSTDLAHWNPVERFTSNDLYGICRGNGMYVAVGDQGTLFTSTDARAWTGHEVPGDASLASVAFGNGVYVAVGISGSIVTSVDGANWSLVAAPIASNLYSVTFGGGRFVAVGENGAILASVDGRKWDDHTVASETDLYGVAWGNNTYVAAGGASVILTSPDGAVWTHQAAAYEDLTFAAVTFAGGAFVLAADHDAIRELAAVPTRWAVFYFRSPDGMSWKSMKWQESYVWQRSNWVRGMLWTGTQLVSFGEKGSIQTSPDGMRWTNRSSADNATIVSMASGDGLYVAVGTEGNFNGAVYSSSDGLTWQHEINPQVPRVNANYDQWQDDLYGVAYGDGNFVAVGSQGTILRSGNGHSWTVEQSGTEEALLAVARIGDIFVTVGYNGTLLTSPDGHVWTSRLQAQTNLLFWSMAVGRDSLLIMGADVGTRGSPTIVMSLPVSSLRGSAMVSAGPLTSIGGVSAKTWMAQVAYGNGRFVAVADDYGANWYSDDGIKWQAASAAFMSVQRALTFAQGLFVSVGDNQAIATSPDGVSWTARRSGSAAFSPVLSEDYLGVYGDAKSFLASSSWGTIAKSSDGGSQWTDTGDAGNEDVTLTAVADTPSGLVAVGELGTVRTSLDGISWLSRKTDVSGWIWGVSATPMGVVAVGESGLVMVSSDLAAWKVLDPVMDKTLTSVAAGDGHVVAVGDDGTVITSDDCQTWTLAATSLSSNLISVAYGQARFVAVGQNGAVATSPDGQAWKSGVSGVTANLNDIVFKDGRFVVAGGAGTILTSTDGTTWTRQSTGTTSNLFGVTALNNGLLAVGDRGMALVSTDGAHWNVSTTPTQEILYGCAGRESTFVAVGSSNTTMWTADLVAPTSPVPVQPLAGATVDAGPVTLVWSAVAGAVSYDVQTSTTADFGRTLTDKRSIAGTSVVLGATEVAASGSTYWRVRAVGASLSSGWSTAQSFTVRTAPAESHQIVLVLHVANTQMTVNGDRVAIDVAPQIVEGRTLLPIKWVAEPLGATVSWDAGDRRVTVSLGSTTIELWIGKSQARVNGKPVAIDPQNAKVVPLIVSGRTMLPVRFVSEQLGADVGWDGSTRTVTVTYQLP
jgi:hypothetical protein